MRGKQYLRAAASIGANIEEAQSAELKTESADLGIQLTPVVSRKVALVPAATKPVRRWLQSGSRLRSAWMTSPGRLIARNFIEAVG